MTQTVAILTGSHHPAVPAAIVASNALPPPATIPPPLPRTGPLRSGNPRGNPNLAPRCGAKARTTGCPCQAPAMPNGRCRLHGGKSTGPRTPQGLARLAQARTTHGNSTAAARAEHRHLRTVITRSRILVAAMDVRPYLPSEIRRRLDLGADELAAPPPLPAPPPSTPPPAQPDHGAIDQAPIPTRPPSTATPDARDHSTRRDAHGRFTRRPRPTPGGQKAEREAARLERAMLAPWRAGIKRARLVKRLLTYQAQNARRTQHTPSASLGANPRQGTNPSPPPADAPGRRGSPAARTHFAPSERNPIQREKTPNPAQSTDDSNKDPIQRGTVAPQLAPTETSRKISDKTPIQRGTVPRPAHTHRPAAENAASPPRRRDTAADPTSPTSAQAPASAQANIADKTPMQRGTAAPTANPFRQALLAGTASDTMQPDRSAALPGRTAGDR